MRFEAPDRAAYSLRDLLPAARWCGAEDVRFRAVSADARLCQPGDVFIALSVADYDGHDYITLARNRGARAVISTRPAPHDDLPTCQVADTGAAFGVLCQALAGHPSRQMKVIGITGTSGKTTTSLLVASILRHAGSRVGQFGTLGWSDGNSYYDSAWTTPPAPIAADALRTMVLRGCSYAVLEVSSHALVQGRIAGVEFDTVAVTNVRHDHLDFHGTHAAYLAAKGRIFDQLAATGLAVINADDAGSAAFLPRLTCPTLTVSVNEAAEVTAEIIEQTDHDQTFMLVAGDESAVVRSTLVGMQNLEHCLLATAIGLAHQVRLPVIARAIESLDLVPGRLERIECGQPFRVFVDAAQTADALCLALDALRPVVRGRLICVFGAEGEHHRRQRPQKGLAVADRADLAVITSDNPRHEDPESIIAEILTGMRNETQKMVILDRKSAIQWALDEARPGDCVLIAGQGHETTQIVGEEVIEFDDREVARDWLRRPVARVA